MATVALFPCVACKQQVSGKSRASPTYMPRTDQNRYRLMHQVLAVLQNCAVPVVCAASHIQMPVQTRGACLLAFLTRSMHTADGCHKCNWPSGSQRPCGENESPVSAACPGSPNMQAKHPKHVLRTCKPEVHPNDHKRRCIGHQEVTQVASALPCSPSAPHCPSSQSQARTGNSQSNDSP